MKHRLLSVLLIVTVMASVLAGAMAVSVLPAKAADAVTGYFNDLMEQARNYCPAASLSQFDDVVELIHDNFDNWLVVIIYKPNDNSWYVASYAQDSSNELDFWGWRNTYYYYFYPTYRNDNTYSHSFTSRYGFKIKGNSIWFEPYGYALGNQIFDADAFWQNSWSWSAPTPDDINESSRSCYTNIDLHAYNGSTEPVFLYANLENGNYAPPVIEYNWFKFNLGDRWYITTYDQSLIQNVPNGDDSFWVWSMYLSKASDPDNPQPLQIWYFDVQYLSFAETFISQNLTNVSSSGVLAYDITELILDPDCLFLANADFYQVMDTPTGMFLGNLMAESNDQVDLILTPSEDNNTQDEAWTVINNYFTNYPSVTVAPKELASQFSGQSAYSGGIGTVQIPQQLYEYRTGNTLLDLDSEFHYDLASSGLQPSEMSFLNFDLLNVVIVPARNSDLVDAAAFNLRYWDYELPVVNGCIDSYQIGHYHYSNDLFESFDLILIVEADSWWLQDTSTPYSNGPYTHLMYGYTGDISPDEGLVQEFGLFPCYWVLTRSAIQKSQLYVFCDGFEKLYDLAFQVCNKHDLWESSFFDWSMSIFWELETVNGHLFAIENEILGWKLSIQFEKLFDKLDSIGNNMVEPDLSDVDPWYLPLWNWVNRFAPSVNDFSGSIEVMDDTFDSLPAIPQVTDPPAIPTLPGFE